jgi:carboxylesterase
MANILPKTSKKGYALKGDKAQVVLFHGYTGSPYDLRPLSDFFAEHDIAVSVPLLYGHGTTAADLNNVTAEDWLLQAEEVLLSLDYRKPIILGGLSMGALIAIILTANNPKISLILLFSPSLKLNRLAELTIGSAGMGMIDKNTSLPKLSGGSDIADPLAKKKSPAYKEMPIGGLLQLEKLRLFALERLSDIRVPIFAGFGTNDTAIEPTISRRIIMAESTQPIVSKVYSRSKHVITLDYDRGLLAADVLHFLTTRLGIPS